ncbi:MAG: LysR family transcriptional regulator [Anaerolineae bacterium]|nr:LysR family transcriptional regulator [Anaerolineae bacterium]MDW8300343.1 LysR family transcriptional regulator [Anaerolineae bacterium]
MLDLYKLRIFMAVAQEGSFRGAAERLYITQSAISQHIKDLETSLGRQLFERGWRGVTLTTHGELLQSYAQRIFELVAEAENALTNLENLPEGKLTIGATPGVGIYLAPDWIGRFRSRYAQFSVTLQTGVTAQVISDILAQRLELGFVEGELDSYQNPRLGICVLQEVPQMVIVGTKHAWWDAKSVCLEQLRDQPFIVRPPNSQSRIWLEQTLRAHGIEPHISAEFDNIESTKRAVAAGVCITILPHYVVQNEVGQGTLRALPIEGNPLRRTLKLVWDQSAHFTPIGRAFLDMLRADYPSIAEVIGKA